MSLDIADNLNNRKLVGGRVQEDARQLGITCPDSLGIGAVVHRVELAMNARPWVGLQPRRKCRLRAIQLNGHRA